tara:strand:+ start:369 stop:1049 length:681 start_codon:yes stop_codon:yes gene_type:complete
MAKMLSRPKEGLRKFLQEKKFYRTPEEIKSLVTKIELRLNNGKPVYWVELKGKWVEYHKFIWRSNGYRIPQFTDLIFINGRSNDVRISNLTLSGNGFNGDVKEANQVRNKQRITTPEIKAERKNYWNKLLDSKEQKRKDRYQQKLKESAAKKKAKENRKKIRERNWSNDFLNGDKVLTIDTTSGKRRVKVDSRTTIYVSPEISDEQAIQNYLDKRKKSNEEFRLNK